MTRLLVWAAFLFSASPAFAQEKQLLFEAPKGTSDADRLKASKAFAARCVAHGFKDVTGDTVSRAPNTPRHIRLLSDKGFTDEMRPALEFLSSFLCRRVELRFNRRLTDLEKEEYKEGEKAPKGCSWVKHQEWETVAKPFLHFRPAEKEVEKLYLDKPVIDVGDKWKIHRHKGGDLFGYDREAGVFLTFKGTLVKTIYGRIVPNPEKPGTTILPINLFIDGLLFSTEKGSMGWRNLQTKGDIPDFAIWTFPGLHEMSPITWLLENPLPFPLKRVE